MVQIRSLVGSKEYSEFKNLVILLENSFAEIDKNGNGIQQVHLAITPEVLVTATYVSLDPNYTTLELQNIIPLNYLRISVQSEKYRRIRISTFKGCNRYYELSERNNSSLVWRNWCDRILFLNGELLLSSSVSDMSISSNNEMKTDRTRAGGKEEESQMKIKDEDPQPEHQDYLKDVMQMLDYSGVETTEEMGVTVNKSIFNLLKTINKPEGNLQEMYPDDTKSAYHHVPRFASGVSEKCGNRLALGEFSSAKKKLLTRKSCEAIFYTGDAITLDIVEKKESDTSVYFSSRADFELFDDEDEKNDEKISLFLSGDKTPEN